jgi:hypothetical protein
VLCRRADKNDGSEAAAARFRAASADAGGAAIRRCHERARSS